MENKSTKKLNKVQKAAKVLKEKGPFEVVKKTVSSLNRPYVYMNWFKKNRASKQELEAQRNSHFDYEPKVSILVPTYRTPIPMLKEMVASVTSQTYGNWELCIADGSVGARIDENGNAVEEDKSTLKVKSPLQDVLSELSAADPRIVYKVLSKNGGISYNTNQALEMATGDFIALLDHDDILEPNALYEIVEALQDPDARIVYTDEDKATYNLKKFMDPNFKPEFSIDLFRSHNYITHLFVCKTEIMRKVGGFNSTFDGAQDFEIMYRCIEEALCENLVPGTRIPTNEIRYGEERVRRIIRHVPKVLYHWRLVKGSTAENPESKMYAYEAGRLAIQEHLNRAGTPAKVEITSLWGMYHAKYEVVGLPLVSIIIPNKDHVNDLDNCIRSIIEKSSYKNLEFIIAENNSTDDATFKYYEKIKDEFKNVKIVKWEKEFNYSAINNFAAGFAGGEYLLFLNNDTELITDTGIAEMLAICERKDVGIVGAKLIYPDETVQHAGIVLGFRDYAQHVFCGIGREDYGFMVRARINVNYNAVTGACLMVSKADFEKVSGFSEDLPVAGNDVDFCLKIRELGLLVVFNAFSEWYHFESKSRGYEDTPEKKARFEKEIDLFRKKWGEKIDKGDEFYNPNFSLKKAPYEVG
jgi:GT2 family glycosyltransferase